MMLVSMLCRRFFFRSTCVRRRVHEWVYTCAASDLHSPDGPDFKGIARPNILRIGIQRPEQFLTASSAARGRRSEPQRYSERRSARAPPYRLLVGGVGRPPAGAVRGSQGEGRPPPGRRVAGWGGPGGRAASPPASQSTPQSSVLRTENNSFSFWKSSRI